MQSGLLVFLGLLACVVCCSYAQDLQQQQQQLMELEPEMQVDGDGHVREKRTLFLKKKLLGAGLLGLGLGFAKGYKFGYHSGPEVHHVYLAPPPPPPVRYVEYIEKPVFVQKVVEKPVFKPHDEYAAPGWSSQPLPDPSPVYGSPSW